MSELGRDVSWAFRALWKAPGFTLLVVLTLALAIGVNSAIFSMVSVVFFSDLPIDDGDTFGFFYLRNPERGLQRSEMSLAEFLEYREGVGAFAELTAARGETAILTGDGEPVRVRVGAVTPNMFPTWGTEVLLGRPFADGEDRAGAAPVVILSHGLWSRRYASDPAVLGTTIEMDGVDTTVVGVMGTEMEFGDMAAIDLWKPLRIDDDAAADDRARRDLFVTGRLAEGASLEAARGEAELVARRLQRDFPGASGGWLPQIQSFDEGLADQGFWTILSLLTITVGLVMLIACSNVATLMLARGSVRARELAVRAAMGAGRLRLMRQLLAEGALLSLGAAVLGLGVAWSALEGLRWIAGDRAGISSFVGMLRIDVHVLAFTLLVAAFAPLLFSLLPAIRTTRRGLVEALKESGGRASGARGALRGRRLLVGAQVALALTLMVVAGVLVRTMLVVRTTDLGYDGTAILTLRIDLPESRYGGDERRLQFYRDTMDRLRADPGIEAAAWTSHRPLAEPPPTTTLRIADRPAEAPGRAPWAGLVVTGPGVHDMLGMLLVRGRLLETGDTATSLPVALVSEETASRYWPGDDPVGQRLQLAGGDDDRWLEVVGVVADLARRDPDTPPRPAVYVPLEQMPRPGMALLLRPRGETLAATGRVRDHVRAVDPDLAVSDVRTMRQIFNDSVAGIDTVLSLLASFALFALAMAAAGIHGVASFTVTQRSREFGIRMALGADRGDVRSMVMRHSALVIGAGAALGLLGGWALATFLAAGTEGIVADDPLVYAAVAAALVASALLASYLPARRATRVDPVLALRVDR